MDQEKIIIDGSYLMSHTDIQDMVDVMKSDYLRRSSVLVIFEDVVATYCRLWNDIKNMFERKALQIAYYLSRILRYPRKIKSDSVFYAEWT